MATDDTPYDYSPSELRQMDEETARQTLTVAQYERREKLIELYDEADETRAEWDEQTERVTDLTVNADMDDLGTDVDVFGNDLLVHIDPEDDQLTRAAEDIDDLLDAEGVDPDDLGDADADVARKVTTNLIEMLDAAIVRWNGTEWDALGEDVRRDVLAEARQKWGLDGFFLAWVRIAAAVHEDREEQVSVIEKFRDAERRGRR